MAIAVVTGSSGLIGSETAKFFHQKGYHVIGIDNNLRKYFFGEDGSTEWKKNELEKSLENFTNFSIDIRHQDKVDELFKRLGQDIEVIIHTAAQPSHDWAAREPLTDYHVNATGTLNLLEAFRQHCPKATFIFTSTNKVYGDTPNRLPLKETPTRWEIDENHSFFQHGIDESMSIDHSKHSLFGASKAAADLYVQEYGRYFNLKTGVFRGGCLTGPAHSGAELHGFLAYLVKCAVTGRPYTIFGYKGKQVRDNIHSYDLVNAFWHFSRNPGEGKVYNMGGARHSNCSILEAIALIEDISGHKLQYTVSDENRSGDHIWYISDVRKFKEDYPEWDFTYDMRKILTEIINVTIERENHETRTRDTRPQ